MNEKIDDDAINYLLRKKPKITTTGKASDIIALIDSLRKNQMTDTDRRKLELWPSVETLVNAVIGFSVNLRETKPCWKDHADVGVLFAFATTLKDAIAALEEKK